MPKYVAAYETDISVYATVNGSIAIEGLEHLSQDITDSPVKILLSIRQASKLLQDLPELIKDAQVNFVDFTDSEGNLISEQKDSEGKNA